jgi:hypothetical protein
MQYLSISILVILAVIVVNGGPCANFVDRMYHLAIKQPAFAEFDSIITLQGSGIFTEIINIATGLDSPQNGAPLQFSIHQGFYECKANRFIKLTNIGYVYKKNDSILGNGGAFGLHQYELKFPSSKNNRKCTGIFRGGYFSRNASPFGSGSTLLGQAPVFNITCILLNGRKFMWPN